MQQTKVIIMLGAPGSGKGTQSKRLAKQTNMIHISTGDLCRDAVRSNSPLGKKVDEFMKRGDLVSDDLIIDVIESRLREADARNRGVILDGFPRTYKQTKTLLNRTSINIDRVILLQVPNEVCSTRIMNRLVDPQTDDSYSSSYVESKCQDPTISSRLTTRQNDRDEPFIKTRLECYYINLGQVLLNFKDKTFVIDGSKTINEVQRLVMDVLKQPITISTQESQQTQAKDQSTTGIMRDQRIPEQKCIICVDKSSDHASFPCGHQFACEGCMSQIFGGQNPRCSVCRRPMQAMIKIFPSGFDDMDVDGTQNTEPEPDAEACDEWARARTLLDTNRHQIDVEQLLAQKASVSITPCTDDGSDIAIIVDVPDVSTLSNRMPVDICCVIDTSGSMALDATYQDPNDETKTISENGLTILDLVKHSVKTVINILTEQDRLSLVDFNYNGKLILPLTRMNAQGKQRAITVLEGLFADGGTNIWGGLEAGLNSIRSQTNNNKYIFLLTDGQPNTSPPRGEVNALMKYMEQYPDALCQINTFGFGYHLDSALLLGLATFGRGTFSFIPDAKILGTCFVNAVANSCSTICQNCVVHIVPQNGARFIDTGSIVKGNIPYEMTSWGLVVKLGPLQFGQARDIVVTLDIPVDVEEYVEVTVEYGQNQRLSANGSNRKANTDSAIAYIRNYNISQIYDIISKCTVGQRGEAERIVKALIGQTSAYNTLHNDKRLASFLDDLAGRISKSVTDMDRFNRWGRHYLRCIARAHQLQICTNFMDGGLQVYGGSLFSQLRQTGSDIFLKLEMKKSYGNQACSSTSSTTVNFGSSVAAPKRAPSPVRTVNYYGGGGGGCFDESCYVMTEERDHISVKDVRPGDLVATTVSNGLIGCAKVQYVVRMERTDMSKPMVKFLDTGLVLTQKHPVFVDGRWRNPIDLVDNESVVLYQSETRCLYNFILDEINVALLVNEQACVSFGHGIFDVWHPLYASEIREVIADLDVDKTGMVDVDISYLKSLY